MHQGVLGSVEGSLDYGVPSDLVEENERVRTMVQGDMNREVPVKSVNKSPEQKRDTFRRQEETCDSGRVPECVLSCGQEPGPMSFVFLRRRREVWVARSFAPSPFRDPSRLHGPFEGRPG